MPLWFLLNASTYACNRSNAITFYDLFSFIMLLYNSNLFKCNLLLLLLYIICELKLLFMVVL